MAMRTAVLLVLLLSPAAALRAAEPEWFPGATTFLPPLASPEESRISAQQQIGSTNLRVGLGAVPDLVRLTYAGGGQLSVGLDAWAFALSSTIAGARLKIDLVDGSFGAHVTWTDSSSWSARFRALHISAHIADGTYDQGSGEWLPDRTPIPFSRNFFELTGAYTVPAPFFLRPYGQVAAAWFNRPKEIQTLAFGLGADAALRTNPSPYTSVHFALLGVPEYAGTVTAEAGVRFGRWEENGLRVYCGFTSGLESYGQFYNRRVTFWSVGASFDLWRITGGAAATMSGVFPR